MQRIVLLILLAPLLFSFIKEQSPTSIPEKPEVIFVKGGTFVKGAKSDKNNIIFPDESIDTVTVKDINIGKYEISVSQYKAFCNATARAMPEAPTWGWQENHPIVNVTYFDALSYCEWLGKKFGGNWRLPTEEEWEYAAKGGDKSKGYKFSGGNDLANVAWFEENANAQTHIIGTKAPNELGIYDMTGNVWEWTTNWYGHYNFNGSGYYRVVRGGSWLSVENRCYNTRRNSDMPNHFNNTQGFRVVFSQN